MKKALSLLLLLILTTGCSKEEQTKELKTAMNVKQTATKQMQTPIAKSVGISGKTLYKKKCKSCHGKKAEKRALKFSTVISAWSEKKIYDALIGYKNKTYGRSKMHMMYKRVKNFSNVELQAIAKYITTIK